MLRASFIGMTAPFALSRGCRECTSSPALHGAAIEPYVRYAPRIREHKNRKLSSLGDGYAGKPTGNLPKRAVQRAETALASRTCGGHAHPTAGETKSQKIFAVAQ
jgi:hypothetical protein